MATNSGTNITIIGVSLNAVNIDTGESLLRTNVLRILTQSRISEHGTATHKRANAKRYGICARRIRSLTEWQYCDINIDKKENAASTTYKRLE